MALWIANEFKTIYFLRQKHSMWENNTHLLLKNSKLHNDLILSSDYPFPSTQKEEIEKFA